MSAFDISILSRLEINSKSTVNEINRITDSRDFRDQLKGIKVRLEPYMTKKEQQTFIANVNRMFKSIKGQSKDGLEFKVGVGIDESQAISSLNGSLKRASEKLESIKINVDAQVDEETIKRKLVQPGATQAPASNTNRINSENSVWEALKRQEREYRLIKGHSIDLSGSVRERATQESVSQGEVKELAASYSDVKSLVSDVKALLGDQHTHLKPLVTNIIDLRDNHKLVNLEMQTYNKELKKAQQTVITAQTNDLGQLEPIKSTTTDYTDRNEQASLREATKLLNDKAHALEILVSKSSQYEPLLKNQITNLRRLAKEGKTSSQVAKQHIRDIDIDRASREAQTRAIKLQTVMLQNHQRIMQQNKRFIDKSGMKSLEKDIRGVNLQSSSALASLQRMQTQMQGYAAQAAQATRSQMGVIENFNNAMVKFPIWMAASTVFYGVIRSTRAFIDNIIEIDTRMITLQKVMSDSADMEAVFNNAQQAAERFGQTIKDVLDAYAEFARQGYEDIDLSNFGDAALIASNVGEISSQEASEFLTAAAAQWRTGSEEAMRQVDSWNEIANSYATTVEKLGEGHAKSGATARAMGLDFHETNAILGALTAQTKQSGSEIGNFIKSAFPRIYAGAGQRVLKDLGVDLETVTGETKSAITLLREVAFAMDDLSTSDRADAIRGLGGVWHYQRMEVLLETLRDVNGMYDQMEASSRGSFGSAAAENAVYMESLEARVNKARVAVEQLSLAFGEAFLESGIIDAVTAFTWALSKLTDFMNNFGTVTRNLGLGAVAVVFSQLTRSMRQFRESVGVSLFDPVAESARRLRTQVSLLHQGMSFKGTKNVADTMKKYGNEVQKNIVTSRNYSQQLKYTAAEKTKLRASIEALNAGKNKSIVLTKQQSTATQGLSVATKVASRATTMLAGAFRTVASMTVIGLGVSLVTMALEGLIKKFAKTKEAMDEVINTNDVLRQSLESDAGRISDLVDQYERYERTINSGRETPYVMEEHKRITEELSQLFPDLVEGNQEYGTVLEDNVEIMKVRIDLINQEIEAERELNRVRQTQAHQTNVDDAIKAQEKIAKMFTKDFRGLSLPSVYLLEAQAQMSSADFDKFLGDVNTAGRYMDDYDEMTEVLALVKKAEDEVKSSTTLTSEAREAAAEGLASYRSELERILGDQDLMAENMKLQEGGFSLVQLHISELEESMSRMDNYNPQFIGLFGRVSNEIIKATDDINVMENAMTKISEFATTDVYGGKFRAAIDGWTSSMEEYNKATTDEGKFAALEKVRDYYEEILQNIEGLLYDSDADLGLNEEQRRAIIASLEAQQSAYLGLGDVKAGAINDAEELANVLESETDAFNDQTEAVKSLTEALKEADKEIDTISKALEQIGELGALETDTLYDILDLYPELLGMQLDAAEMEDFLNNKRDETHQRKLDRYIDEMMYSKDVLVAVAADEGNKLNILADMYEADLENFDSINDFKETVLSGFNKYQLLENAAVLKGLADIYGIDLDNFEDLAHAKGAVEYALMKEIIEVWNDYISQLDGQLKEYAKRYKGLEGMQDLLKDRQRINLHGAGYDALGPEGQRLVQDSGITEFHREITQLSNSLDEMMAKEIVLDFADINFDPKTFDDVEGLLGKSLDGAGDRARANLNRAGSDSGSSSSKASEKELRDLNIEVERQVKTFQKQTFVMNEYEEALRKVNLEIEKQKLSTSSYASHTANYRRALQREIELNQKKLEIMQAQEKSLEQQIKSGNLRQYGMLNEDINVAYNRYNVQGSGDNVAQYGTVTRTADGQISPFAGWRTSYNMGKRNLFPGESYHYGQDFVSASGTPIHTPHGGRVIRAGWGTGGQGNWVAIYNDALDKTFSFMHMLSGLNVKVGDVVEAGTMLGRMGSTGRSTGTHLHFQVNQGMSTSNSKAINPSNYLTSMQGSWLGQVGRLRNEMSTGVGDYTGASLSAERAEYLNALEQAQLDAIEQRINTHNESQQKASDIYEAQKVLDQMTMDRLALIAEIREQIHEITLSQIEEFDVDSGILDHRIAKLEYDAERLSRMAGETSDSATWRKYMEEAMEERAKQTAFKQEQIDYIQQILANDANLAKADRMSERSRFELEETLRGAKTELINLQRAEDDALSSILQSRTNERLTAIDDAMNVLDRKLQAIETKRRYIDQTYDDGAQAYRESIQEEIDLNKERANQMSSYLIELRELRETLKEQPELYRQTTETIHEMEDAIADTHASVFELNKEIAQNAMEKSVENLTLRLEEAQEQFDKLQHQLEFVDAELQQDIYFNLQSDVLVEMDNYKKAIIENIRILEAMESEVKQYPEIHKQVTDEIKNWQDEYRKVNVDMHNQRKQFTDAFLSSIKDIYQRQQDLAISAIDKEYSEFEKMVNKKLELIDKQYDEETYSEEISEKQSELVKLRAEIAQRMGDDSLQNQARLKELREELADQEDDYNKFIADKERERRKEALQQELEDARENAEDRKETVTDLFEDLLNDQRKFNEVQEELMQGQIDKYKDLYSNLTEFVKENTEEIGRSLSEGLLDSITAPFEALLSLSDLLERAAQEGVDVPISGLKPTNPALGNSLIDFIHGTSNSLNIGANKFLSPILGSSNVASVGSTTHNAISSLINIENFNGTKQEKDDLLNSLVTELRRKGVLI